MCVKSASQASTLADATFHSIEELNDYSRAIGREGEFVQLSKGPVTSKWRLLHLGECSLISHRADKRMHARVTPPKGGVAIAVMPPPYCMLVDGREFGSDQILMIDSNSQRDFVVSGEFICYTLILPESVMEATGRALVPRMRTNGGLTRIWQCPSSGWSALHGGVTGLLRNGSMSPEDFSHLLSRFLGLIAGEREQGREKVHLGYKTTVYVAQRAQEYIEDHFRQSIRVEEICRYTGVSLSTLGRSFSKYFQVTPREYIKARRFNAARQALLAGDPSQHKVGQIALANGFTHLGRFSVEYFEYFGERGSETLARRG